MTNQTLKEKIKSIPDHPKPGILFRDITPLLGDKDAFHTLINTFAKRYENKNIDAIVGLEARGFIIGAALAYKMNISFIPIRKPGKLPGKTLSASFQKEYGTDTFEIHQDALKKNQNILIIDDLIATGGTASAAIELVEKSGANVHEVACLIELTSLKGREKLTAPLHALIKYD